MNENSGMKKMTIRYLRRAYIRLQRLWYKLVTLKSSPQKIALGFAMGLCVAYTPTIGIQTVLVLALAALFRVNPVSATVGVYMSNPVTIVPMYALCYKVGAWILGAEPAFDNIDFSASLLSLSKEGLYWIGVEAVGAVVVGVVTFPIAYLVALWVVVGYRRARLNRRIERMRAQLEEVEEVDSENPNSDVSHDAA